MLCLFHNCSVWTLSTSLFVFMSVAVIITCFQKSVMIVSVLFNTSCLTLELRAMKGPSTDENIFRPNAAHVSSLLRTSLEGHLARDIFCWCLMLIMLKPPPAASPQADLHVVGMSRFMSDINQASSPLLFVLFLCLFLSLWPFHSIKSPDNSPFSHSVLPVLSLPDWSFQLYSPFWKSPSALI